jgi:dimeric dUTPase (all-alpha-NTP-PPase superfamily)
MDAGTANDFSAVFAQQLRLQIESYDLDPQDLMAEDRAEFIRWNVLALEDELHEALNEVGWKPWATSRHLNRDAYKKELVDALHFFTNLCLVAGISADELIAGYFEKAERNAQRQVEGYDGVTTKCPNCKRELDDKRAVGRTSLGWECWGCQSQLPDKIVHALIERHVIDETPQLPQ